MDANSKRWYRPARIWLHAATCVVVLAGTGSAVAEKVSIVATVNDDVITTTDVAERRTLMMANAGIPDTPENVKRITPRVVEMLTDEALQLQEAKRQSITITDEDVAKAMDGMGAPVQPAGAIKKQIIARGLSLRSLGNQVRAQLAWGKVVQRKLRRNVIVTQDELALAQQAQSSERGIEEMRLAVMAIGVPSEQAEQQSNELAKEIAAELASGRDMPNVADKYRARPNLQYNPMLWVTEERTPPALYALIKDQKLGQLVGPVRTGNVIQFIKMLERRMTKKPAPTTEVLVKQITIEVPTKGEKDIASRLVATKQILLGNPGNCEEPTLPATPLVSKAVFARTKMGNVPPEQQSVLARLDVGGISEPQILPGKLQYLMLCERSESAGSPAANEGLKQELFAEKMELEAQKHLRNLRREATIDVRSEIE